MTCTNCNKSIQENDKFCGFCGTKIVLPVEFNEQSEASIVHTTESEEKISALHTSSGTEESLKSIPPWTIIVSAVVLIITIILLATLLPRASSRRSYINSYAQQNEQIGSLNKQEDPIYNDHGLSEEMIRKVQEHIRITPTGTYGPGTTFAVKQFQKNNGLYADGIAGQKTLQVMGLIEIPKQNRQQAPASSSGNPQLEMMYQQLDAIATQYRNYESTQCWDDGFMNRIQELTGSSAFSPDQQDSMRQSCISNNPYGPQITRLQELIRREELRVYGI